MTQVHQTKVELSKEAIEEAALEREEVTQELKEKASADKQIAKDSPTNGESQDNALEEQRDTKEKNYDGTKEEELYDTAALFIFENQRKFTQKSPDYVVSTPKKGQNGFQEVGVGWTKQGANGKFVVIQIKKSLL